MATPRGVMRLLSFSLLAFSALAARADDVKDDIRRDAHDLKRSVNKAGHRVDEAACTGSKTDCAARKGRHRFQETKEKAGDKVDEIHDELRE
jgi:hypothetical protein